MRRRATLLLLLIAVSTGIAFPQSRSFSRSPQRPPALTVDISQEPSARQLLANSSVRVYRIDLRPGAQTALNRHDHDFLVVSLGGNQFEFVGNGNVFQMSMSDGEAQVMKGRWAHRIVNKSQSDLHLIEVEAMRDIDPERAICGIAAQSCTGTKFAVDDDTNYVQTPLFETSSMRLERVEIGAGKGMPQHRHQGDHLMIALTDVPLMNAFIGGDMSDVAAHAGDAAWLEAGIPHRIFNRGSQPARFLTIECK